MLIDLLYTECAFVGEAGRCRVISMSFGFILKIHVFKYNKVYYLLEQ